MTNNQEEDEVQLDSYLRIKHNRSGMWLNVGGKHMTNYAHACEHQPQQINIF